MTMKVMNCWMKLGLAGLAYSFASPSLASDSWRFDKYSNSTDCGDRKPLTEQEELGLTRASDTYRILAMIGKEAEKNENAVWMILAIDGRPMNQAGEFPKGRCANKAILKMSDGQEYAGITEYKKKKAGDEHPGYSYRVLFEKGSPIPELRYDATLYRIDGHLSYPEHGENTRPFAGWWIKVEQSP